MKSSLCAQHTKKQILRICFFVFTFFTITSCSATSMALKHSNNNSVESLCNNIEDRRVPVGFYFCEDKCLDLVNYIHPHVAIYRYTKFYKPLIEIFLEGDQLFLKRLRKSYFFSKKLKRILLGFLVTEGYYYRNEIGRALQGGYKSSSIINGFLKKETPSSKKEYFFSKLSEIFNNRLHHYVEQPLFNLDRKEWRKQIKPTFANLKQELLCNSFLGINKTLWNNLLRKTQCLVAVNTACLDTNDYIRKIKKYTNLRPSDIIALLSYFNYGPINALDESYRCDNESSEKKQKSFFHWAAHLKNAFIEISKIKAKRPKILFYYSRRKKVKKFKGIYHGFLLATSSPSVVISNTIKSNRGTIIVLKIIPDSKYAPLDAKYFCIFKEEENFLLFEQNIEIVEQIEFSDFHNNFDYYEQKYCPHMKEKREREEKQRRKRMREEWERRKQEWEKFQKAFNDARAEFEYSSDDSEEFGVTNICSFSKFFKILELSPKSTKNQVKLRARELLLKYHPDKHPDDQEAATLKAQTVINARDVLLKRFF